MWYTNKIECWFSWARSTIYDDHCKTWHLLWSTYVVTENCQSDRNKTHTHVNMKLQTKPNIPITIYTVCKLFFFLDHLPFSPSSDLDTAVDYYSKTFRTDCETTASSGDYEPFIMVNKAADNKWNTNNILESEVQYSDYSVSSSLQNEVQQSFEESYKYAIVSLSLHPHLAIRVTFKIKLMFVCLFVCFVVVVVVCLFVCLFVCF